MTNLEFFKACMSNELQATHDVIAALPADKMSYKPEENSRTAYEIAEHIVAHIYDLDVILNNGQCDEKLTYSFENPQQLAEELKALYGKATQSLETMTDEKWESEMVELLIEGQSFITLPRMHMMWFFHNDIIHHRGQLTTYIRPMGGKNPAVYGYSYDTQNAGG